MSEERKGHYVQMIVYCTDKELQEFVDILKKPEEGQMSVSDVFVDGVRIPTATIEGE